jgi:hypothetical protein
MPRKDPISGCMVMTMPEFLNAEAEREGQGRTGGDILQDIMTEMSEDDKRCSEGLKNDHSEIFSILLEDCKSAVDEWLSEVEARREYAENMRDGFKTLFKHRHGWVRENVRTLKEFQEREMDRAASFGLYKAPRIKPYWPLSIVRILDAQVSSSFRSSGRMIVADILCNDGVVRRAKACHSYWSGTRMDPPEEDCEVTWFEPPTTDRFEKP